MLKLNHPQTKQRNTDMRALKNETWHLKLFCCFHSFSTGDVGIYSTGMHPSKIQLYKLKRQDIQIVAVQPSFVTNDPAAEVVTKHQSKFGMDLKL